ncbi:MAG: hypothetical protein JAY94_14515 [Candidatus Thiodiazotropha endolucinida]|nr:hypothetical protein [Candidatus Thiodiazotropha taylori]MCW4318725.1 hypothetical protein [Candidatus Thiodiazotropha taylori]
MDSTALLNKNFNLSGNSNGSNKSFNETNESKTYPENTNYGRLEHVKNTITGDQISSSLTTAETLSRSPTTSEKLLLTLSHSASFNATSLDSSEEPTYAPKLTRDHLNTELKELRNNKKFQDLEAKAESKLGSPLRYEITENGVGYTTTNVPVVYIGRYAQGYCYTSYGKDKMSYDEDTQFYNNDASKDTIDVQVPFSVKRVIVHEVAHHIFGLFDGNEANVISVTNEIMSDYGEHPRALSHQGFLIDADRF